MLQKLVDVPLIRASFHTDEAEAILSLPLPRRSIPDSLLWHYDKTGFYTVRSGYWVASMHKGVASSSSSSHLSWWKRFWQMKIPPKIKIFLWKAYHNWIPTAVNLARHGVPIQKCCLICGEANDSTVHALWGCKILSSFKVLCDVLVPLKTPPHCDMKELLLSANDCLTLENLEFLCTLLWRIWFRRNKWLHEKIWLDDNSCVTWAKQHLADFKEAIGRKGEQPGKVETRPWQGPEIGMVKVNTDAAWCSRKKKFGLGTVIRDANGKVLGSCATPIPSSVSVAVAESWALERGATLARQLGYPAVTLESDNLGVIKALDQRTSHASELCYVYDSIYDICNDFQLYNFSYTPRIGNQVAHSLARLALSLANESIWPTSYPESIKKYVLADIQQLSSY